MPVCVAHGDAVSTDDATCQCDREPAWCFVHRRWGRRTSSPPTRTELVERVRDLTATIEAQAADIATAVARAETAERERDAALAEAERLRGVMRREIANTEHHENCPMRGTTDDADPRCNCVVGALHRALTGGAS